MYKTAFHIKIRQQWCRTLNCEYFREFSREKIEITLAGYISGLRENAS
jgi:hypothetical protein